MVSQQTESSRHTDLDGSLGVSSHQERNLDINRPHIPDRAWVSNRVCGDGRVLSYIQNLNSSSCR